MGCFDTKKTIPFLVFSALYFGTFGLINENVWVQYNIISLLNIEKEMTAQFGMNKMFREFSAYVWYLHPKWSIRITTLKYTRDKIYPIAIISDTLHGRRYSPQMYRVIHTYLLLNNGHLFNSDFWISIFFFFLVDIF